MTHHFEFSVVGMRMFNNWVVAGSVIGNQEGPPPAITPVMITTMQDIGMDEEGITWFHLHFYKRKNLQGSNKAERILHQPVV